MSRALRRRYGHARGAQADVDRWSANSRKWWARAERKAPVELEAYRKVCSGHAPAKVRRAALERLKKAMGPA